MKKLKKLKKILKKMGSVLLAYSAGVDSTFLLKAAKDCLKDNLLAVTACSATYPKEELVLAKKITRLLKVRHQIIKTSELKNKKFSANPLNRCYFCKKELFLKLKTIAKKHKLNFVIDGSNFSDQQDYRPGNKAKKELGIRSPLQEAGLTKEEIRSHSRRLNLATWDKPSLACLSSRIPYRTKITLAALRRIHQAELFLRKQNFSQVRLRHYNGLCRIEIMPDDFPRLLKKRRSISKALKSLGYHYVTLDLEGFRSGSMNIPYEKNLF